MSLIDEIKSKDDLDGTLTIKINSNVKEELIEFCAKHKISMGKLARKGITLVLEQLEKEVSDENEVEGK